MTKRMMPSPAQARVLRHMADNEGRLPMTGKLYGSTMRAIRFAGWIAAVHPNKPYQVTALGRDALTAFTSSEQKAAG